MESKIGYRHIVDAETKRIFIESVKEAIKNIDKNKFGFIGIIGSIKEKYSHDIDILIFPSKSVKLGEAMLETIKFYSEINKILKKKKELLYAVPCPRKIMQEMVYYLSSLEEGHIGLIPVHSLFFPDYKSFKKYNPPSFKEIIKKDMISMYGNFNIIKELPELPDKILYLYFFILDFEMSSRIKNFPRHLIRASAESLFSYVEDKIKNEYNISIKLKKKDLHDIKRIEKEFLNLIKKLDKITYKKAHK